MKKSTSPTMADIARHVGVSRTAVSFVLNGRGKEKGISEQMEQRILKASKQLNYRPSLIARSLVTNRSMTIGLVLPNMGVTYGPPLAETIEMGALDRGYQVILCHHGGDEKRFGDILQVMTGRHVDGLIVVPTIDFKKSPLFDELLSCDLPSVFIERDPDDPRLNFVTTDVTATVKLAIQHLIELGHKNLAFVNAAPDLVASQLRQKAFEETLANAGLNHDNSNVLSGCDTQSEAAQTLQQILQIQPKPTAVITVSAERAMALFVAAQNAGINIPKDLSLVTISGVQFTPFHRAQITEVRLAYEAVGKKALEILLQRIEDNQTPPKQHLVNPKLEPGDTTAPPQS